MKQVKVYCINVSVADSGTARLIQSFGDLNPIFFIALNSDLAVGFKLNFVVCKRVILTDTL